MVDIQLADLIPVYPKQTDPQIQTKAASLKELGELESSPTEPVPDKKGQLFKHQEFIQRFMIRIGDNLLMKHRTGTGKSKAIIAVANALRAEYIAGTGNIRQVLFLSKGTLVSNEFINQIISEGSYDEFLGEAGITAANKKQINKIIKPKPYDSIKSNRFGYIIKHWGKFTNELRRMKESLFKNDMSGYEQKLKELYSNTLIVMDEAHNIKFVDRPVDYEKEPPVCLLNSAGTATYIPGGNSPAAAGSGSNASKQSKAKKQDETYDVLHHLFHVVEGCKIILSTATPMINNANDIKSIMNLILPLNNQMPESLDVTVTSVQDLEKYYLGRVSFIRELANEVITTEQGLYLKNLRKTVYLSEMVGIQREVFNSIPDSKSDCVKLEKRSAGLFTFPDGSYGKGSGSNGTIGFEKYVTFNEKLGKKFQLVPELVDAIRAGRLPEFSCKYNSIAELYKNSYKTEGCVFVYSEFEYIGAILIGLILEQFGYSKYEYTGDPIEIVNGKEQVVRDIKKKPRYALLTDKRSTSPDLFRSTVQLLNSESNVHGDYIKIVVGSPMTNQSINLFNIVAIHLISTWWNDSVSYQAESRGKRANGGINLIKRKRELYFAKRQKIETLYGGDSNNNDGKRQFYQKKMNKYSRNADQIGSYYNNKIYELASSLGISYNTTDDLFHRFSNPEIHNRMVNEFIGRLSLLNNDSDMTLKPMDARILTENQISITPAIIAKVNGVKKIKMDRYVNAEDPAMYFIQKFIKWVEKINDRKKLAEDYQRVYRSIERDFNVIQDIQERYEVFYNTIVDQYSESKALVPIKIYNHLSISFNNITYVDYHRSRSTGQISNRPTSRSSLEKFIVQPDANIKYTSIDYSMYEISLSKEIDIKHEDRKLKLCDVGAYIMYNRNYRSTDKDDSAICDYSKCDYKHDIVDQTPFIMGSNLTNHRILYADTVYETINNIIINFFSQKPTGITKTFSEMIEIILFEEPTLEVFFQPEQVDFYFLGALNKLMDKKFIYNGLFNRVFFQIHDNLIYTTSQYPISDQYSEVKYLDSYYDNSYNTAINMSFFDYLGSMKTHIAEEIVEKIYQNPSAFDNIIYETSIKNRITLVEYVIEHMYSKPINDQYNEIYKRIYARFGYAIFYLRTPVDALKILKDKIKTKYVQNGNLTKITAAMERDVPNEFEQNGDPIFIHNLYIKDTLSNSGIVNNIRLASNKLRIMRVGLNETWRTVNNYELLIYRKLIQEIYANRYRRFDSYPTYGIVIDLPNTTKNFYMYNKLLNEKAKGREISSYNRPDLVKTIIDMNIAIPMTNSTNITFSPSDIESMREIIMSSPDIPDYVKHSLNNEPTERIYYFYYLSLSSTTINILSTIIGNYLVSNNFVLYEQMT
jgi:hypothetical protein